MPLAADAFLNAVIDVCFLQKRPPFNLASIIMSPYGLMIGMLQFLHLLSVQYNSAQHLAGFATCISGFLCMHLVKVAQKQHDLTNPGGGHKS